MVCHTPVQPSFLLLFFKPFRLFSTCNRTTLGWWNSLLLFSNSWDFRFLILTPSFASLVRGSLNCLHTSILNSGFSFGWSFTLCLYKGLPSFFFLSPLRCSSPRILAFQELSPSYTLVIPLV